MERAVIVSTFLIFLFGSCSAKVSLVHDLIQDNAAALPSAPDLGCTNASFTNSLTGVIYRSYVCSGPEGACVLSFVDICDKSVLAHFADQIMLVFAGGKKHAIYYYTQRGGETACRISQMPECCSEPVEQKTRAQSDSECRCIDHEKTGERFCDPIDCEANIESYHKGKGDCKCQILPTGERLCDPLGCKPNIESYQKGKDDCRCEDLPTGERLCDPLGCKPNNESYQKGKDDCRCEDLPTGERICDPFGCEPNIESYGDCECQILPTGERLCDPLGCKPNIESYQKGKDDCRCEDLPTGERICDPYDCETKAVQ